MYIRNTRGTCQKYSCYGLNALNTVNNPRVPTVTRQFITQVPSRQRNSASTAVDEPTTMRRSSAPNMGSVGNSQSPSEDTSMRPITRAEINELMRRYSAPLPNEEPPQVQTQQPSNVNPSTYINNGQDGQGKVGGYVSSHQHSSQNNSRSITPSNTVHVGGSCREQVFERNTEEGNCVRNMKRAPHKPTDVQKSYNTRSSTSNEKLHTPIRTSQPVSASISNMTERHREFVNERPMSSRRGNTHERENVYEHEGNYFQPCTVPANMQTNENQDRYEAVPGTSKDNRYGFTQPLNENESTQDFRRINSDHESEQYECTPTMCYDSDEDNLNPLYMARARRSNENIIDVIRDVRQQVNVLTHRELKRKRQLEQ